MKEWDRQKGERNLWFDRFTRFRLLGPDRSLLAVYNEWQDKKGRKRTQNPATSWRRACKQWNWRRRAEAWDEAERQRLEAEYEAERIEWREKRRQLLQGFFGRLAKALSKFDAEDVSLGQLSQATRMIADQLRAEYNDLPTEKREITGAEGGPIAITTIEVVKDYGGDEPVPDGQRQGQT